MAGVYGASHTAGAAPVRVYGGLLARMEGVSWRRNSMCERVFGRGKGASRGKVLQGLEKMPQVSLHPIMLWRAASKHPVAGSGRGRHHLRVGNRLRRVRP